MPDKWWYDAVKGALSDLREGVGFNRVMTGYADRMRERLMQAIVENQPHGHEEYDPMGYYAVGTVSERIGHTPIEDGWRPEITDSGDKPGVKLKLNNISEHIRWVLEGSPAHPEPAESPYVFFWWGAPQRWPQPPDKKPGYFKFATVNHPGQQPNPFVRRARDETRSDLEEIDKAGVSAYLVELMTNAGLRRA